MTSHVYLKLDLKTPAARRKSSNKKYAISEVSPALNFYSFFEAFLDVS